jgi:dolichol kinase
MRRNEKNVHPPGGPLSPFQSRGWVTEAQRKVLHLAFILLPLELLYGWLPWPRERSEWRVVLVLMVVAAIAVDLARLHDRRVGRFFRRFFGELIREHERFNLLGSTYLLLASLLAIELFPRPMAAAAIGFTVLGDGLAAIVGRAYGRTRFFGKSLEGAAGGLAACLAWAAFLVARGHLPWEVAIAGALVASLIELLPIPLDDNLGITLFAGYTMKLLGGGS